jgi:4-hydroxybenzoate polyprenyltransferase
MTFRSFRPLNLLMVALTQLVCWVYLRRSLPELPFQVLGSFGLVVLLVLSTVCITAAGYLINDVFDVAIDARNKPGQALPDVPELKQRTLRWYRVLNGLGLVLALPVAYASGKLSLLAIQALTILLLWAYSAWWKRLPVVGNLVVAALTALSIALLYLYEPALWNSGTIRFEASTQQHTTAALLWLAAFALILTWMREMVKDIEDLDGDRAEGCRTLPIVWGVPNTIRLIALLAGLVVGTLTATIILEVTMGSQNVLPIGLVFVVLLILPLAVWTLTLVRQHTPAGFHRHSNLLKLLMLGGLVCLWLL